MTGSERDFWKSYTRFREQFDLEKLNIDPTEIFGFARDSAPGKEVNWHASEKRHRRKGRIGVVRRETSWTRQSKPS